MLARGVCVCVYVRARVHGEAGGGCTVPLIQRDETYMGPPQLSSNPITWVTPFSA